jgi:hypothetical protein
LSSGKPADLHTGDPPEDRQITGGAPPPRGRRGRRCGHRHSNYTHQGTRATPRAPKPPALYRPNPTQVAPTVDRKKKKTRQPWVSRFPASGSACSARRRWSRSVWKSTSVSGARGTGIDAIEQASRRWRGGRRDDSARTRRKLLIPTQRILMVGLDGHVLCGNQPVNLRKLNLDLTPHSRGQDDHPLQAQVRRGRDDDPHDRLQRRDGRVQEH